MKLEGKEENTFEFLFSLFEILLCCLLKIIIKKYFLYLKVDGWLFKWINYFIKFKMTK